MERGATGGLKRWAIGAELVFSKLTGGLTEAVCVCVCVCVLGDGVREPKDRKTRKGDAKQVQENESD